jgi:hypothetical protein
MEGHVPFETGSLRGRAYVAYQSSFASNALSWEKTDMTDTGPFGIRTSRSDRHWTAHPVTGIAERLRGTDCGTQDCGD